MAITEQDDVFWAKAERGSQQFILSIYQSGANRSPGPGRNLFDSLLGGFDGMRYGHVGPGKIGSDVERTVPISTGATAAGWIVKGREVRDCDPVPIAQQVGQHGAGFFGIVNPLALANHVFDVHRSRGVEDEGEIGIARGHV